MSDSQMRWTRLSAVHRTFCAWLARHTRHRRSVRVLKRKAAALDSRTLRKGLRAWLAAHIRRRRNRTRGFGFAAKRQRNWTMRILREWRRVAGAARVAARKGAVPIASALGHSRRCF